MNSNVTGEGVAPAVVKKKHCNFRLLTLTFEHKHEDKSCSACRQRVNERMRECESVKVRD